MNTLVNKNIALIVTGSISAYKAIELLRLYIKAGAKVKVVLSEDAKKFVAPLTFEALSANVVLHNETESWADDNNHIGVAKWADICVVAPATVNTIAKIANGVADNLATQVVVASTAPKLIAPAANTNMYKNSITIENINKLKNLGYIFADTQTKLLACGDIGDGGLASESEIFYLTNKALLQSDFWINRDVIITGGGTMEPIDDVRYITNASSGKMAASLATAAYIKGANVTLICTSMPENLPLGINIIIAKEAKQMHKTLEDAKEQSNKENVPFIYMAAAVADFAPIKKDGKYKKSQLGATWNIELFGTVDILLSIKKDGFKVIGFKAETDEINAKKHATDMLTQKNLDAVVLNIIGVDTEFGSDNTRLRIINKNKETILESSDKLTNSFELLEQTKTL